MAKHLYVPLNMGGLEVQNMRMHLVPNVGTSELTDEGRFAYDSANHVIKYRDNTASLKTIATQEWAETKFTNLINSLPDDYISWTRWEEIEASWTATINDLDTRLSAATTAANNAWSWVSANMDRLAEVSDNAVLGFEQGTTLPKSSNLVQQTMMGGTFVGVTIVNGTLYGVKMEMKTSGTLPTTMYSHSLNWSYADVKSPEYYKKKGMCIVIGHDIYQYDGISWNLCYSGISEDELTGKQDVITDLDTIRSNASGAMSWVSSLGLDAWLVASKIQDVDEGESAWNYAATWVNTNGANVLTYSGYAESLFEAIDENLDNYSFANFGTFLSDVEEHINDGVIHISAAERNSWNGKQDAISDLSDIRNNSALGAEAYGWGNHASVGYDAVVPFVEVPNVGELGAGISVSAAPSAVTSDHVLVFSTNKGFLYRKITTQAGTVPVTYYDVKKTTQFGGETMESLHTYGKCVSINGSIYKFFGEKWTAQAAWVLVHKGVNVSSFNEVYNWGNHADAGYASASNFTSHANNTTVHITAAERTAWNNAVADLDDIRDNADLGAEAHGWGNHANAGYAKLYKINGGYAKNLVASGDNANIVTSPSTGFALQGIVFDKATKKLYAEYKKAGEQTGGDNGWGSSSGDKYQYVENFASVADTLNAMSYDKYLVDGYCITVDGAIWKRRGGWSLVYEGARLSEIDQLIRDVDVLKAYFDGQEDADNALNKWHEIVNFLENFGESDKLLERIQGIEGDVTDLQTNYESLATSDAKKMSWGNVTVNGVSLTSDSLSLYAPTSAPDDIGMAVKSRLSDGKLVADFAYYKDTIDMIVTTDRTEYIFNTRIPGRDVVAKCYIRRGEYWEEIIVDVAIGVENGCASVKFNIIVSQNTFVRFVVIG